MANGTTIRAIEQKILGQTYKTKGIAIATVKRVVAKNPKARATLLELVEKTYVSDVSASPPPLPPNDLLDQQLLRIAFQLLNLCIEHKLTRAEIYKRLDDRLQAGVG